MRSKIYELRRSIENFVTSSLGAYWHGAGTDMTTGEVDFTFNIDDAVYSLHIKKLKRITRIANEV